MEENLRKMVTLLSEENADMLVRLKVAENTKELSENQLK